MKIKKFEANNIETALYKVKQEMGPEALIVNTQKKRVPSKLWFFKKDIVEVTAALDVNLRDPKTKISFSPNLKSLPKQGKENITKFEERFSKLQKQLVDVSQLIGTIKRQLSSLHLKSMNEAYTDLFNQLIINQVDQEFCEKFVFQAKDAAGDGEASFETIKNEMVKVIAKEIKYKGAISINGHNRMVVALVGPTGVGKTTTIAKLAAHFSLAENKKVALITADTYRIAAVDQLKTYTDIMNIPMEVIVTPDESRAALAKHSDKDIVFVDTAGRSPNNKTQINELKEILDQLQPHQTHLVLSAATNMPDTFKAIDAFMHKSVNRILFTKLDETLTMGQILNVLIKTGIPLSYITNGQDVPEDIALYSPDKLAEMVLSGAEEPLVDE